MDRSRCSIEVDQIDEIRSQPKMSAVADAAGGVSGVFAAIPLELKEKLDSYIETRSDVAFISELGSLLKVGVRFCFPISALFVSSL